METKMMDKIAINIPDKAPLPLGAYSHAMKAGPFIYLCGLGARDAESGDEVGVNVDASGKVTDYDIKVQTHAVMKNMVNVLEAANCTFHDLVDVSVYLADMKDFAAFNEVYAEYFNFDNPPARTTIQAVPPGRNFVEIKAIAYKPE